MKKRLNSYNIFIIIGAISVLLSFLMISLIPDKLMDLSAMESFKNVFNDFEIHVNFATKLSNVYERSIHACFPPFIYIFYHLISCLLPSAEYLSGLYVYIFLSVINLIISFILFVFVCRRYMQKENDIINFLVLALITLSNCFVFGVIQCANISFFVLMLLMLAIELRESESKVKQELALIFIAIAAAIKIYPAVFGLLYIIEKKRSQAIRLVIYGILFFTVPFAFTGGFNGLVQFIVNLTSVQDTWGELSPNGIYNNLLLLGLSERISKIAVVMIGLIAFILFAIVKDNCKKLFILCFIMVMCPLWSGAYTPAFFVLPFLYMMKENKYPENIYEKLYIILFSLIFTASCFSFQISSVKIFVLAMIILFSLIAEEIVNKINSTKSIKRHKKEPII